MAKNCQDNRAFKKLLDFKAINSEILREISIEICKGVKIWRDVKCLQSNILRFTFFCRCGREIGT